MMGGRGSKNKTPGWRAIQAFVGMYGGMGIYNGVELHIFDRFVPDRWV